MKRLSSHGRKYTSQSRRRRSARAAARRPKRSPALSKVSQCVPFLKKKKGRTGECVSEPEPAPNLQVCAFRSRLVRDVSSFCEFQLCTRLETDSSTCGFSSTLSRVSKAQTPVSPTLKHQRQVSTRFARPHPRDSPTPPTTGRDLRFLLDKVSTRRFHSDKGLWTVPTHSSTSPVLLQHTLGRPKPETVSTKTQNTNGIANRDTPCTVGRRDSRPVRRLAPGLRDRVHFEEKREKKWEKLEYPMCSRVSFAAIDPWFRNETSRPLPRVLSPESKAKSKTERPSCTVGRWGLGPEPARAVDRERVPVSLATYRRVRHALSQSYTTLKALHILSFRVSQRDEREREREKLHRVILCLRASLLPRCA